MHSRARLFGHPIHPMLVPFPIAFLLGAFFFDILERTGSGTFASTAYNLNFAGVVCGLIAAVPGLIDYWKAIPRNSQAKRTAFIHMCVNIGTLAVFFLVLVTRGSSGPIPIQGFLLEIVGVCVLLYGGWLGGKLVYKQKVAVSERAERRTSESSPAI